LNRGLALLRLARAQFLAVGVGVYAVGIALSLHGGIRVDLLSATLGLASILSAQLMTHFLNEYFDFEGDLRSSHMTFSGGSGILGLGVFTRGECLGFGMLSLSVGLVSAVASALRGSPYLLPAYSLVVALSAFYSAPPLRLVSTGFGELAASLVIGILAPLSAVLAVGGVPTPGGVLSLFPLFACMGATMLAVEAPDHDADAAAAKRNLVVRLGLGAASKAYAALFSVSFISLAASSSAGLMSWSSVIFALPSLPLAAYVATGIRSLSSGKANLQAGALAGAGAFGFLCLGLVVGLLPPNFL
jgi:1,4-dihydroxy-2-naphthoate octaprenyltransferase